ncbi:MAG: ATP-binding protein [Nitrospirota bacterium]|nr:ATP-binding protein [Nitrospirota bacterium]
MHAREELPSRIKWLMASRVVLVMFLLGSLFFFQYQYQIYHVRIQHLVYFGIAVCVLAAIYSYLFLKTSLRPSIQAYIQIAGDIALITWLVSLTGGIDSTFSILYHITIISASILLARRGGYFGASLASISYGGLLDVQYYNALGFLRSQAFTAGQVLFLLFVNIISFYVVAFLSGYLSERLRRTRQELQEKSSDFDDLRVLQDHILRSVGSGITTMDMSGKITSWNNAAENITGYGLDEIRDLWTQVFGESIKGLFGRTEDLRAGPVRFEGKIPKKNGVEAVLGFTASLLKDESDDVRGIILTFQDITRLVQMEEKIRRQERLATVGSLAAGIAHEIRNPLASLSGSIQMLREELVLSNENRNLMDIVLRETDRLNTIITEFLDYARPKTSSMTTIPIATLMQDTVVLFRNSRNFSDSITIQCDIDESVSIHGDPSRIRQVLWNLLINASQAIEPPGTITLTAACARQNESDAVVITVADTGTGIDRESLPMIFDPFFTTKSDGTGLGLAIAYRIIEDHQGTIDVKSVVGKGTIFTMTLPIEEASDMFKVRLQKANPGDEKE